MSKKCWSLIAFAGMVSLFPVLVPNPYYLNVANIIGLTTIIIVGLNLLIGFAGQISLGHAAFYGLGAYLSGILTVTYGISPWWAMFSAVVATALLALLIGIPTLKLHGHYLVMATLGFNLIVNIIMVQWDKVTGGPSGFSGIANLSFGNWVIDSDREMYYVIWFVVIIAILLALNLVDSRVGRGLRALHASEIAADSLGVPTKQYKVKVFVLSALYASLAGSLYAHYLTFISPKTFDIFCSVELVTMVIVGGMGSIWGSLFGTAFLTSLPHVIHYFDEYRDIFYGLILVLILVFLPEGVMVTIRRKWRAFRNARRDTDVQGDQPKSGYMVRAPKEPRSQVFPLPRGNEPILRVERVSMRFGGLVAVSQVSLELPPGSITALIGPNGAGKTTLINMISGVYAPLRGTLFFNGKNIKGLQPYQIAHLGLARTFQNIQVFDTMTVIENVMVGMHTRTHNEFIRSMFHMGGFNQEEARIQERAWEVLHFFGLESKADLPANSLAYGEQKRLEMARALASSPTLLLLDEPVAGLNLTESKEVARLIERIRDQGISVLLVEHDMNLVMGISDKVVVLNYGRKIAEGTPREIQKNEEVLTAYLGNVA